MNDTSLIDADPDDTLDPLNDDVDPPIDEGDDNDNDDHDDAEMAYCPAWLPLYFRNDPRNTIRAMIPPDRDLISLVARDSDGSTQDLGLTIGLSYESTSAVVPFAPDKLDLKPFQNKEVTFTVSGIAADATAASLLARLDNSSHVDGGNGGDGPDIDADKIAWQTANVVGGNWTCLAYGNDKFVATAGAATAYSTDGVVWTTGLIHANYGVNALTYGDGKFVALTTYGNNRVPLYSSDGIKWTASSTALTASVAWNGVAHGNGMFVAVGTTGTNIFTSADGAKWTATATPFAGGHDIAFGAGKFVVPLVGGATVASSSDGILWTQMALPQDLVGTRVRYGNGVFVMVPSGKSEKVMISRDGVSWSTATVPGEANWNGLSFAGGLFFLANNDGKLVCSGDGVNWAEHTVPITVNNNFRAAYGNEKYVAVGGTTYVAVGALAAAGE